MGVRDENNDAPIHAIVKRPASREKFECLMTLLIHTPSQDLNISLTTVDENTALHLALQVTTYVLKRSASSRILSC